MTRATVQFVVPFDSLLNAVSTLGKEEKRRLWEVLYEQLEQADEMELELDPIFQAEIQGSRADYRAGNTTTIEDYLNRRKQNWGLQDSV
jgi:hypothetical protein